MKLLLDHDKLIYILINPEAGFSFNPDVKWIKSMLKGGLSMLKLFKFFISICLYPETFLSLYPETFINQDS